MKQELPIQKKVFDKNTFNNVIDRNFNQLINLNNSTTNNELFNIDDFFALYDQIFFDIPKEGNTNSHQYLITKSSEYLGIKNENSIDIQLLQDEITSLREQLLEANQTIENFKILNSTGNNS